MKKPKKPKSRNPIAKVVSKMQTKVKKPKNKTYPAPKDMPSTGKIDNTYGD